MQLGIFAKTFVRPSVEELFVTVRDHGLTCVQFNMACVGLPSMPDAIDPALSARVREAAAAADVEIVAVSGTYNMIHPDPAVRETGLRRLRTLAAACADLGTNVITLCTGTRDRADQWRWHDDNTTDAAWRDLLDAMTAALEIADEHDVTLAFEPERANVVYSAERGRALLDAMQSPRLKVIFDPANLIVPGEPNAMRTTVATALDLLADDLLLAHAKDRNADDTFAVAGQGILDYEHYLALLEKVGFTGPLVIHGLEEDEVAGAVDFLCGWVGC